MNYDVVIYLDVKLHTIILRYHLNEGYGQFRCQY